MTTTQTPQPTPTPTTTQTATTTATRPAEPMTPTPAVNGEGPSTGLRANAGPGAEGSERGGCWRARWTLVAVTLVSFALNAWNLTVNGAGNQYYAAATRSMTQSWSNFFFASYDPGGFISVDKPPVFLWIDAASARVFGVNSWSLMLPSAVAGAGAVAVLWCIVRRRFGVPAATVAALVLALSPINVAVNRLNLPEPFLILFLLAAAWAVLASFESKHPLRMLFLAGGFAALAFNTKMLAAYIPLPALALAILVGTRGWPARLGRAAVFGISTIVLSLPWVLIVDLIPAGSRPFVGGSTNDTVWDLVFGYNGFGRVNGASLGGGGGGGVGAFGGGAGGGAGSSMSGAGGVMGGVAGPWRMFSDAVGGQIAWLVPLAVVGVVAAASCYRRDRERRAAIVLWAGWLLLYAAVFSKAQGTFHSYYTAAMAPAIAALVGIGASAIVPLVRRSRWWLAVVGVAALATVQLQLVLAGRVPTFYGWTRWLLIALVVAAGAGVTVGVLQRSARPVLLALGLGLASLLVVPAAWSVSETDNAVMNATLPQAGPRTGMAASTFGSASSNGDPTLASFLLANNTGQTWDLVVSSAQVGSGLEADQGVSVMALGGFMGTDASTSVGSMADKVAAGQVRYFRVSGGGLAGGTGGSVGSVGSGGSTGSGRVANGVPGGGGGLAGGPGATGGSASTIMAAVRSACAPVTTATSGGTVPASYAGSIYDCAGRADALRAAAS